MGLLFWVALTVEWYGGVVVFRALIFFFFFFFCSEAVIRKNTRMRTTSVIVIVIFFESVVLKVPWLQLCSKFFFNNYETHLQRHLRYTLQSFFKGLELQNVLVLIFHETLVPVNWKHFWRCSQFSLFFKKGVIVRWISVCLVSDDGLS